MAKTNTNTGLDDISGRISKWVYRRVNGRVVIAARPRFNPNRVLSQGQIDQRLAFRTAAAFARSVMADPLRRPIYEAVAAQKQKPIFALAIGDYFKPPLVDLIDPADYHGKVGEKVRVLATDDVQVMSVHVAVRQMNGTLIEQGPATEINKEWFYTATTLVPVGTSVKIEVVAKDRPAHEGRKEITYVIA